MNCSPYFKYFFTHEVVYKFQYEKLYFFKIFLKTQQKLPSFSKKIYILGYIFVEINILSNIIIPFDMIIL